MNLRHSSCSLAIAEVHILPVENAELQDALQTRTLVVRTCGGLAQGITPKPFHPKNATLRALLVNSLRLHGCRGWG